MATTKSSKNNSTKENVEATNTNKQSPTIEELMAQIVELKNQINQTNKVEPTKEEVHNEEKMIRFISLARGSVLLKGTANRPYEIEGRFSERMFSESEAKAIVNLMGSFMREGYVYIDDAKFVKSVGLADAYKSILTPEVLKNLFNQNPSAVISAYENSTEGQRRLILDMIFEKKNSGESVDANILMQIGKMAGIDLIDTEE